MLEEPISKDLGFRQVLSPLQAGASRPRQGNQTFGEGGTKVGAELARNLTDSEAPPQGKVQIK